MLSYCLSIVLAITAGGVFAEINPKYYLEAQQDAPEVLKIRVLETDVKRKSEACSELRHLPNEPGHQTTASVVAKAKVLERLRSESGTGRETPQLWTNDQIIDMSKRMDPMSRRRLRNCSRPTDHTTSRQRYRRASSRTCCDSTRRSRTL